MKDSINKTIVYEIQPEYKGDGKKMCEKLCGNYNWALVPKIPKDYSIRFLVNGEKQRMKEEFISLKIDSL